ncbi:MAG: hypothetical protein RLN60_01560 [Phycisphaerales bacterium]
MLVHAPAPSVPQRRTLFTRPGALLAATLAMPLAGCGWNSFTVSETSTEVLSFTDLDTYHTLIVDNRVGDITLTAEPGARAITAEITKIGKGSTEEHAKESLEKIEIVLAPVADEPGVFVCTSEFPKNWHNHGYAVDWRITAPSHLILDVLGDVGEIAITGFTEGVAARTDVGDIEVIDVQGGVDLRTDVGDIVAVASGAIIASSDVGDIDIRVLDDGYMNHTINLNSDVGDITVRLPAYYKGLLNASTDVGDVEANFSNILAHNLIKRSKNGNTMRAELNGAAEPALEMHAEVGDVELRFERPGG